MENTQSLPYGKTSPAHSVPTKVKTSDACSNRLRKSAAEQAYQFLDLRTASGAPQEKLWVTGTASRGGSLTRNTGECPSAARESTLCQILQANAPEKYYLSARSCEGILRRAERRGKTLLTMLREALEEAVAWSA